MTVLLTGATGMIGRYLLKELLLSGVDIAVLVRATDEAHAQRRVGEICSYWEQRLGYKLPRPRCLVGDLAAPGCGLTNRDLGWLRNHCGEIISNAASMQFQSTHQEDEPYRTNVGGARHIMGLCREAWIEQVHYVSTAYVCGKRNGVIYEDELACGQDFHNDYERSKFEAEQYLRIHARDSTLTVYRPSILVGDSETGHTTSFYSLYQYLRFTWVLSQMADRDADGRWHYPVRLNFTGDEELNVVPVDWVAQAIAHLVTDRRHHGRTYHLTAPEPITTESFEAVLAKFFNYYGVEFVGPSLVRSSLSDLEKRFYDYVAIYAPYLFNNVAFDRTNTEACLNRLLCPPVSEEMLARLFRFAVRTSFGRRLCDTEWAY